MAGGDSGGKWVQVRSTREHRRLLFRYNPGLDLIEVKIDGEIEIIPLNNYRLTSEAICTGRVIDDKSFDDDNPLSSEIP